MKREMIKTTVVCLLLGMVGAVFLTGSAFAAEDEGQPIIVPTVSSGNISVGGPGGVIIAPGIISAGGASGLNIRPGIISVGGPGGVILGGPPMLPDLVPVSPPGSVNFCDISTNKPVVRVQNIGGADANFAIIPGVSRLPAVRLDFETSSGTVTEFLPPSVDVIPASGFDDIGPIETPSGCFSSDCNFKITINPGKPIGIPPSLIEIPPIPESNTANNIAFGRCIG